MRRWIFLLFAVAQSAASAQDAGQVVPLDFKTPDPVVYQTHATDSPDQVVWRFFDLCTRGKGKEAWALAAPALQSRITPERLQRVVELAGVKELPPISWKVQDLAGTITWVRGDYLPSRRDPVRLCVILLYEDKAWRVYSAYSLAADMKRTDEVLFSPCESTDGATVPPLPTAVEVEKDFRALVGRLQARSASASLREKYATMGGVQRTLRTEPDMETPFRLLDRKLVIDPAASIKVEGLRKIENEGFTGAQAFVDVGADSLDLTLFYALTKRGWKAFGGTSHLLPGLPEVERLTSETLTRFDDALKRRSFDKFFESISEAWKQQLTVEALAKAFQSFLEQHVEISSFSRVQMHLHGRPFEDHQGLLRYEGHYETKPLEVHFALKFIYEAPAWKLFGIDVHLQKPENQSRTEDVVAP